MSELREIHQRLLALLDELEAMTARDSPDETALPPLRYRLTRTSNERRKLIERICGELELGLAGASAAQVGALRESVAAALLRTSDHVGAWSMREIVRDWNGYCHASFEMRRAMREQIDREKAILYPLLEG